MTVKPAEVLGEGTRARAARACLRQALMVILINIPTMSFGLAMGWVSLASGESAAPGAGGSARVLLAAALTFCASLLGVPLCAWALAAGRKPALLATSAMFVACWSLKLCGGGWWVLAARVCAGLGGAGAWTLSPLLAREMCGGRGGGAAAAALVLANNVGVLLMYGAADLRLPHTTVLWSCLSLSVAHCALLPLMPESPQYLAARGHLQEARKALAWLRGADPEEPALLAELATLPTKELHQSPLKLIRNMFSDLGRRRAFYLCCVMVVGQEACGVLTLMQFAERVFVLARDDAAGAGDPPGSALGEPARHAVMLGAAQLIASALALYLVERVGRKRLMVWGGAATGAALALAAGAARWGGEGGGRTCSWLAAALAGAVFADSAGLQPAPYAMLTDMFDYEYRGCAVSLVGALAWLGNALEVLVLGGVAARAGLGAALALSAALTLSLALFAALRVPETRGRDIKDIYEQLAPRDLPRPPRALPRPPRALPRPPRARPGSPRADSYRTDVTTL